MFLELGLQIYCRRGKSVQSMISCISLLLLILIPDLSNAQRSRSAYRDWLIGLIQQQPQNSKILALPDPDLTNTLKPVATPFNITITTDSGLGLGLGLGHCSQSQTYCSLSSGLDVSSGNENIFTEGERECASFRQRFCDYPTCLHNIPIPSLETFKQPVNLSLYIDSIVEDFQLSLDECGLYKDGNTIRFSVRTAAELSGCSTDLKQPYITLNAGGSSGPRENYTVSFAVDYNVPPSEFPSNSSEDVFLNVTLRSFIGGEGSRVEILNSFQFVIGQNGVVIEGPGLSAFSNPQILKQLPSDSSVFNLTMQFVENTMLVFIDGEISSSYGGVTPWFDILLGFGSSTYSGSIKNIELYSTAATTSEIYSKQFGLPLAQHAVLPDCPCPRVYTDSFGFVENRFLEESPADERCHSLDTSVSQTFRYGTETGTEWSILANGWHSDLTDRAEINITLPQHLLMYSVGGRFLNERSFLNEETIRRVRRPTSMQVEVFGSQPNSGGAAVYVSDDCETDFGLPQSFFPDFESLMPTEPSFVEEGSTPNFFEGTPSNFRLETSIQKRAVSIDESLLQSGGDNGGNVQPKCFSWSDVLESTTGNQFRYWQIPILMPNDAGSLLNDKFYGNRMNIKLDGHHGITVNSSENWYHVAHLTLYTRPHCGGNNYDEIVTGDYPRDLVEYYSIHRSDAVIYECQCSGLSGDRCEECVPAGESGFRYMKIPGVCADCGCTDLSLSPPRCDRQTGQCPCKETTNVKLAGKQCHWFVAEIEPLFGPVAGGTKVRIAGGYFNQGTLRVNIAGEESNLTASGSGQTFSTEEFPPDSENSTISIVVGLQSTLSVGPPEKFYEFQVRPNPIINDINPRTSIISGGHVLTVTGQFMNSVAKPELIIYVRQRGLILKRFRRTCNVIDEFELRCPTASVVDAARLLNPGVVGQPETTTGRPTSPTLPPTVRTTFNSINRTTPRTTFNSTSRTTRAITTTPRAITTTPALNTPFSGSPAKRRRRRDAAPALIRHERSSVDDPPDDINSGFLNGRNDIQFTLGFTFDGYNSYKDLTTHNDTEIQELSILYVYKDPEFITFLEDFGSEVLMYSLEDRIIRMKGEMLILALDKDDYKVTIGDGGNCIVGSVTSNQLTCTPPLNRPEVDDTDLIVHNGQPTPHIVVFAGKNLNVSIGYVYYEQNIWVDNAAFRISMIVLIVIVCCVLLGVAIYCLAKRYMFPNPERKPKAHDAAERDVGDRYIGSKEDDEVVMPFLGRKLDLDLQAKVDRCKIPPNRIKLGNQLGKGNFGLVYKGQLTTPSGNLKTVAVKTVKEDKEMSFDDLENFLSEGTLMIDFKHENVLSLVGVIFEEGNRPLVVLPYMENGDLCTFVKKDDLDLVLADLLHFGYQMANGMAYLAKERFVHRDLAARNCMVDGGFIVKVADFGMSRDVYERDYYRMDDMNKPLPLKWMSTESLKEGKYTSKSDVWAYGITMWELLTRGGTPYPSVSNYHIKEFVITGKRLDKPSICPPIIFDMMTKCWEDDPDDRPTFSEIANFIEGLLKGETKPMKGSDEDAGYSYARKTTKDIPEDYLDIIADNEEENYLMFLSDDAPKDYVPVLQVTPTPAKRTTVPKDKVGNVYVNAGDIHVHVEDEISAV